MTEQRRLLILGLLYSSDMHGYMLNAHLGMTMPISLKKPTAYKILENLEKEGLVEGCQESTGDRKRRVYSLSSSGKKAYLESLKEQVGTFIPGEAPGMVGLSFLDDLTREEAKSALSTRLEKIRAFLKKLSAHSQENDSSHHGSGDLVVSFMKDVVELEQKYIQGMLAHREGKNDKPKNHSN